MGCNAPRSCSVSSMVSDTRVHDREVICLSLMAGDCAAGVCERLYL